MKLGQGFNSFTQELCINDAVNIKQIPVNKGRSQAQTVSYNTRVVDKLSEVANIMNICFSTSIKKGTFEIGGSSSPVDEATFKDADVNTVISVRVANDTVNVNNSSEFQPLEGVGPGTTPFNDIFGDCYISGYIEGGNFTSVISTRSLDREKAGEVARKMRELFQSSKVQEMNLGTLPDDIASSLNDHSLPAETSILVHWVGGGNIKNEKTPWNRDSVLAAAAAFPDNVARCPQRTWAVLTKYQANRSFIEWANKHSPTYKVLDYDQANIFAAELFDRHMDYKLLLKTVETIILNRDKYEARSQAENAIDTRLMTLISVRSALREEQAKIFEAVRVLSKYPSILSRQACSAHSSRSPIVNDIIRQALGDLAFVPYRSDLLPVPTPVKVKVPSSYPDSIDTMSLREIGCANVTEEGSFTDSKVEIYTPSESEEQDTAPESDGERTGKRGNHEIDDESERNAPAYNRVANEIAKNVKKAAKSALTTPVLAPEPSFNFDALMPPEIWEDLLPKLKEPLAGSSRVVGAAKSEAEWDNLIATKEAAEAAAALAQTNEARALQSYRNVQADLSAITVSLPAVLEASNAVMLRANQQAAAATDMFTKKHQELIDAQTRAAELAAEVKDTKAELEKTKTELGGIEAELEQLSPSEIPSYRSKSPFAGETRSRRRSPFMSETRSRSESPFAGETTSTSKMPRSAPDALDDPIKSATDSFVFGSRRYRCSDE